MSLDATPGSASANSYLTVAEADAYHNTSLYASAWTSATTENKERALITATRILDEKISWVGFKATAEQALAWGRTNVVDDGYDVPSTIIPLPVKNATAEFAKHLLITDSTAQPDSKGLNRIKVGTVELDFDKTDTADVLPDIVQDMLNGWGNIHTRGGFKVMKVERAG